MADQAAHLKDQLDIAEFHDCQLCIRSFPLIVIGVSATETPYSGRQGGSRNDPPGYIKLVHSLISYIAVSGIKEPVPVVMHEISMIGLLRRRAKPYIEIQSCGRSGDGLEAANPLGFAALTFGNQ